ncbi:MAG: hypothetical protein R3E88_00025 [Myxococcota bacterium]
MHPQRIALKLFVAPDPSAPVDLAPFTPLFHEFIQKSSVPGLLIDVADYAHVPNGPGIVLIGHDVDYGLDAVGGHAGLLTVRKRYGRAALADVLPDALAKAIACAKAIEADGRTGLRFALDAVELQLLDRLVAPNDDDAFAAAKAASTPVFEALFGACAIERRGADDARKPLALVARAERAATADELLARLAR